MVTVAGTLAASPTIADGSVRRFNRYELKYVADRRLVEGFRDELAKRLGRDPHGLDGFYPVWSTYYDSPALRCYWEKIDGERFRRKLRIRAYGSPHDLTGDSSVWVEIKQRINRVTQKRRVRLSYDDARLLCAGGEIAPAVIADDPVMQEIQVLVAEQRLRPIVTVGYVREAYLGREQDLGLRVTVDSRVRGRDHDLDLRADTESGNRFIIPPHLSIVELKVNERVPYWLTELIARHNLSLRRISKYCQAIDAFDRAPRSRLQSDT